MKNRFDFRSGEMDKGKSAGYMEIRNLGAGTGNAAELYIYGDIVTETWSDSETSPKDITDFLNQIDQNADLTVHINSGGGSVFAGIAIYNILKRHTGHKKGIVDGLAASIASVILMACDEIIVSAGAMIMIHKPGTYAYGNADDFAYWIGILDKCQQNMTEIYMEHAKEGVTAEQITEKLNAETWMNATDAQEIFDVQIEERPEVAAYAGEALKRYKKTPDRIKMSSAEAEKNRATEEENAIIAEMELFGI